VIIKQFNLKMIHSALILISNVMYDVLSIYKTLSLM